MTVSMIPATMQTTTPLELLTLPDSAALRNAFVGKHISTLRTPAIILDRSLFRENCETMAQSCQKKGIVFRAHVKTHKTTEGVKMQLQAGEGCSSVVCSTMMECWRLVKDGLVETGLIKDVSFA
jgi:D-serine deaminase-like pyridoxal phosphate-dependent protein